MELSSSQRSTSRPVPRDEVEGVLARMKESSSFAKSIRLRDLLLFLCERALSGQTSELHEQQIGRDFFGRSEAYATAEDNIVRVTVSQLRKRLAAYFEGEGSAEAAMVLLPRGSYTPVFVWREPGEQAQPNGGAADVEPSGTARRRSAFFALAVVACALAALNLWQFLRGARPDSPPADPASSVFVWRYLFEKDKSTFLVLADSNWALLQDVMRQSFPLSEYVNRGYMAKVQAFGAQGDFLRALEFLSIRQYTSLGDSNVIPRIFGVAESQRKITLRFARAMNMRDVKSNSLILLASRRANPWVEIFETSMNFQFAVDPDRIQPYFVNRSPRAGERAEYGRDVQSQPPVEAYAVVAFVPNESEGSNVLIIEGVHSEATEAAAELVLNERVWARACAKLGIDPLQPHYFEVLLRCTTVGGVAREPEVVACRMLPGKPGR